MDGVWSLKPERGRNDVMLFVTGRDVDEQELALKWDATLGSWAILGDVGEYRLSQERVEIVDAIHGEGKPLGLTEVEVFGKGIGKSYASAKKTDSCAASKVANTRFCRRKKAEVMS